MSKTNYNQHLINPLSKPTISTGSTVYDADKYICVDHGQTVCFTIQSGPVSECGRNGCDATDLIRYTIGLYKSFNNAHPCRENSLTITKLEEALHWQEARTRDRVQRNVEGTDND